MEITKINTSLYHKMLCYACSYLDSKKETINRMNVFPVPDGDTGTNMSLTMHAVQNTASAAAGSLGVYAADVSKAMMRAARGNSGVILSLFFRGVASAFADCLEADAKMLLHAFAKGAQTARSAVMKPVEGTILTVMRECCNLPAYEDTNDINSLFDAICDASQDTLKKTPEMLPALKKAKVLDAGGMGFTTILDGMKCALTSEDDDIVLEEEPAEATATFDASQAEDILFTYCTECIVVKNAHTTKAKVEAFKSGIVSQGDSIVLTEDEEIIKIHVHTNEPLAVLTQLSQLGEIEFSKIENMRMQNEKLAAAPKDAAEVVEKKKCCVLTVANGDGLCDLFREIGADVVIAGGQSMNPSVNDFLKAIKTLNCESAIILPNNSNIVMTAVQAASLSENVHVEVVRSVTIQQGISALLAYNQGLTIGDNLYLMNDAMKNVTSLAVTRAVKNADINGISVKKKQYIGLVNNDLRYVADTAGDCLKFLAADMRDKDLVTILYGKDVKQKEAEAAVDILKALFTPDCEITLVNGMQPVYDYLISAE